VNRRNELMPHRRNIPTIPRREAGRASLKRDVAFLLIGVVLGGVFGLIMNNYVYPMYIMPHSDLYITEYHAYHYGNPLNSYFAMDNRGNAPIDWVRIEFISTNGQIENVSWIGSPLDVVFSEYSTDREKYVFEIENIQPQDANQINVTNTESANYTLNIQSTSQYILGDKIEVFDSYGVKVTVGNLTAIHPNG
jgi:hypothetical protein